MLIWKGAYTPMLVAALFTTAKIWKQLVSINRKWIKKWYVDIQWNLLSHEKEWNLAICSNMDRLGGIMLSEISQRKTNTIWCHVYVESKEIKLVNIKQTDS